jgi:hypothetical protein
VGYAAGKLGVGKSVEFQLRGFSFIFLSFFFFKFSSLLVVASLSKI